MEEEKSNAYPRLLPGTPNLFEEMRMARLVTEWMDGWTQTPCVLQIIIISDNLTLNREGNTDHICASLNPSSRSINIPQQKTQYTRAKLPLPPHTHTHTHPSTPNPTQSEKERKNKQKTKNKTTSDTACPLPDAVPITKVTPPPPPAH